MGGGGGGGGVGGRVVNARIVAFYFKNIISCHVAMANLPFLFFHILQNVFS